ncbi:carboxylate-amine ligase, partial [Crossiella equi]|uniref:carboxylate-amine ligase n=1 Tax=Crossiella equi TaxID=130796 RepID=UPI0011783ADC
GALDDEQVCCACHVHLGIADRDQAVKVSNHLRPWLPTLIALSGNSPLWAGRDTGYASWRTITWHRWPVSGPPPVFASAAHYDDVVGELIESGAVLDRAGVYWDIRPSTHVPTLEIRVADTGATVADTVLLTALLRAAGTTVLRDPASPPPAADPVLLRAACWRAARDGLDGFVPRPGGRGLVPARRAVADL